jgi:hypothetical protein
MYPLISNSEGDDMRPMLEQVAAATAVPPALVLACALAESALNPVAEHWGIHTREARQAIAASNWRTLDSIIADAWPDIRFGYGGQLVLYHYLGDYSPTVTNCLAVRAGVFRDPQRNLLDMAQRLCAYLLRARQSELSMVGGDAWLGALVIYNCGSLPPPEAAYWTRPVGNVTNYRAALRQATALLVPVA